MLTNFAVILNPYPANVEYRASS